MRSNPAIYAPNINFHFSIPLDFDHAILYNNRALPVLINMLFNIETGAFTIPG